MPPKRDLTGQFFGSWEALHPIKYLPGRPIPWKFRCVLCERTKIRAGTQVAYDFRHGRLAPCICGRRAKETARRAQTLAEFFATGSCVAAARKMGVSSHQVMNLLQRQFGPKDIAPEVRAAPQGALAEAVMKGANHASLVRILGHLRKAKC